MLRTTVQVKYYYPTVRDEETESKKIKQFLQSHITSKY